MDELLRHDSIRAPNRKAQGARDQEDLVLGTLR
jgi:hypothetical protein